VIPARTLFDLVKGAASSLVDRYNRGDMIRTGLVFFSLALTLALPAWAAPLERDSPGRDSVERLGRNRAVAVLDHALQPEERVALENLGIELVQATGRARLIVKGSDAAFEKAQASGLIGMVEAISPESRVHATALRELRRRGGAAKLVVAFHADVPVEEAVRTIREAGGWTVDALPIRFGLANMLDIWATPDVVHALSHRDPVLRIMGRDEFIKTDNAAAATLSSVTPLHSAPYDLTGAGVTLSVLDVGIVKADHPEFEGRVTVQTSGSVGRHPTHVTGTIAAKGNYAPARGMAPAVRVHQFSHEGAGTFQRKYDFFPLLGVAADNNSWGYITGWDQDTSKAFHSQWGWYGNRNFGGYSAVSAAVDYIVRDRGTLIVFSAGNEGNDAGPSSAPFAHVHPYDTDDKAVWCVSSNGSGTDCPADPCGTRCETEKHPSDGTFGNVGQTGSSKNVLAVGAVNGSKAIAGFSSRGPTRDGRIKPELVAKGVSQHSTTEGGAYGNLTGTSMAAPVVTGITALLLEQWTRTMGPIGPTADVLKALLIHGAEDLGNPGPDYTFGFGLVNAQASVDTIRADDRKGTRIRRGALESGESQEFPFELAAGADARLTLVWTDPQGVPYPTTGPFGSHATLVDDMDLEVFGPDGSKFFPWVLDPSDPEKPATRGVNDRDPVEQLELTATQGGTHRAVVRASAVPGLGFREFALVSSVDLQPAQTGCFDPHEPNDTPERAWGRLISGRRLTSRLCSAGDVDYFQFRTDKAGPVSVRVTAETAPIRVTLIAGGVAQSVETVGSSQSVVLSTLAPSAAGVVHRVKVEAAGELTVIAEYALEATYGSGESSRQRSVRRR
jgi:subtilisin family serine protease